MKFRLVINPPLAAAIATAALSIPALSFATAITETVQSASAKLVFQPAVQISHELKALKITPGSKEPFTEYSKGKITLVSGKADAVVLAFNNGNLAEDEAGIVLTHVFHGKNNPNHKLGINLGPGRSSKGEDLGFPQHQYVLRKKFPKSGPKIINYQITSGFNQTWVDSDIYTVSIVAYVYNS